jgi:hypothetical protein
MASRRNIAASVIREWAKTDEGKAALIAADAKFPGTRGRLDPTTRQVFQKEHPNLKYAEGVAEAPTFTIPVVTLNAKGLKTTVQRTVTNAEARAALGQVVEKGGKNGNDIMTRGRMSRSRLSDVLSQAEADKVADQFTLLPA